MPTTILFLITLLFTLQVTTLGLNPDGTALLALKYAILSDPLSALKSWNYSDSDPCSWNGVVCAPDGSNVVSLSLPNSRLVGSIPPDIGFITRLQSLDLSGNFFNGTLPDTLFNSSALKELSLGSNLFAGELPDFSKSAFSSVNLSDNSFAGEIPASLTSLKTLTVLSLKKNRLSGPVPAGFGSVEVLDLSANQFSGALPGDIGGPGLRYLNLSNNGFSGSIPAEFLAGAPGNATVDISYNNLTGRIPESKALSGQGPELFAGNEGLCGQPLKKLCVIPSTLSNPPNATSISPAIAVMPNSDNNSGSGTGSGSNSHSNRLKPATIVAITLADLAGIAILGAGFVYLYQLKKQKQNPEEKFGNNHPKSKPGTTINKEQYLVQITPTEDHHHYHQFNAYMPTKCLSYCLRGEDEGATSESRTSDDESDDRNNNNNKDTTVNSSNHRHHHKGEHGSLVMVDGETELEVDTLLKASAFVLGASGSSIVYKAVLQDGTTFAVRRLGESWVQRLRDFEGHVKTIAKLRHPNLVRVRGFYWGADEKLVIYDYVSNGSLATSAHKKNGSTPYHLPLSARLRIAKGVARGLAYIHDKRFVHGNLKPTNILLTPEMEPIISDLGLSWLVYGTSSCKGGGSARQFGSKRSFDGAQDQLPVSGSPYTGSPFTSINGPGLSPYQAPESLKNLKPSPKWDVYSFGIVLLELLTGRVYLDKEVSQWTPVSGSGLEDKFWVLRIADVALRAEIQGKEEAMMSIFKLGFSCASLVPQKRPSMKEALQVLDKIPFAQ